MRAIPDPGFAGDAGAEAPEVSDALAAYDRDPEAQHHRTLAVLQHARVLVPVVAVLGEVEHDEHGRAREKSSDMAAVLMEGRDGRTALLCFSGTEPLRRWRPEARPVPVSLPHAAGAAVQEGAAALVLDVAGPVLFVVEGPELASLAAGEQLVPLTGGRWGWVRAAAPS